MDLDSGFGLPYYTNMDFIDKILCWGVAEVDDLNTVTTLSLYRVGTVSRLTVKSSLSCATRFYPCYYLIIDSQVFTQLYKKDLHLALSDLF